MRPRFDPDRNLHLRCIAVRSNRRGEVACAFQSVPGWWPRLCGSHHKLRQKRGLWAIRVPQVTCLPSPFRVRPEDRKIAGRDK
jgi:hypothetical protein